MKGSLLTSLKKVEHIAHASKVNRLLHDPVKYLFAIGFNNIVYRYSKRGMLANAKLFYGNKMKVMLPAGTDIYLTGGKSHDSEIRLAKFMLNILQPGDVFIDVGAHFGYFTLLAAEIVGMTGKVFSFEASKSTYSLLKRNVSTTNISVFNNAVSDNASRIDFHEFPVIYSEYNAMDITQYEHEKWFKKIKPLSYTIDCVQLDEFISTQDRHARMIKIDVESAEFKVLSGASNLLKTNPCIVVMEYLSEKRGNHHHQEAKAFLEGLGYTCYLIDQQGETYKAADLNEYLTRTNVESDNVVFVKT